MFRRSRPISARLFDIGDIDTDGASGIDRLRLVDTEERTALAYLKSGAESAIRQAAGEYNNARLRYQRCKARRVERNFVRQPGLAFAEAWRNLGAQEAYPHAHLPLPLTIVLFILLAGLDFYVFAMAYAVVDDVTNFSAQWWVGGLLGLVVFLAGLIVARQVKLFAVGQSEKRILTEIEGTPTYKAHDQVRRLGVNRANLLILLLSLLVFIVLVGVGIWIRASANQGQLPAIVMTGLVPIVIISVEMYMYDPLERYRAKPNSLERSRERAMRKKRLAVEDMLAVYKSEIAKIQAGFANQRQVAHVKAADLGLDMTREATSQSYSSEDWMINWEDLLSNRFGHLLDNEPLDQDD
ncbi:MAG: hypothetical protein ACK5MT_17790 [Actinomycetales bacterium]